MKLKFLGAKKRQGCGKCGKSRIAPVSQYRYTLYGNYGIRVFRKGNIYEFKDKEEYEYYKNYTQKIGKVTIKLFMAV